MRLDRDRLLEALADGNHFADYFESFTDPPPRGVSTKVNGGGWTSRTCPFHGGGSLRVNLQTGSWKCFGCGESGSVFDLHMKLNHCDFPTALHAIADRYRIDITEHRPVPPSQSALDKLLARWRVPDTGGSRHA